jgi:ribosomal protein L25 (general stress protein Ctc)
MIEDTPAENFTFGPPVGAEKILNAHRSYVQPKLGSRIEFLAKKMRETYRRDVIFPEEKIYIDSLRDRLPTDTLEQVHKQKLVAAVIEGREEFPDVDIILPHRAPYTMLKADHGRVRPFVLRHNDEEIMVNIKHIHRHMRTREPILMELQRFIPNRPNLVTLPIVPVQEDKSLHFQAGCQFHFLIDSVKVWTFTENFPAVIELDCSGLTPNMALKIGDIERTLPDGMFLHKSFQRQRFHTVVKLTETPIYLQRKNQVFEQADLIKMERIKLQKKLMDAQKKPKIMRDFKKMQPKHKMTTKDIMAEKKEAEKAKK